MHSRNRPGGGFGSSRTPPPPSSRHPSSKSRGDFTTRPPNWVTQGHRDAEPSSYGGNNITSNKFSLPPSNNSRGPLNDRGGDREDEKMVSEATRLAAEYFASKGGGTGDSNKYASRGGVGRFDDNTVPDKYFPYLDSGPSSAAAGRDNRSNRGTQFSRLPYEETSFGHADPNKYDSKFSYREPEKVPFDEARYSRGGGMVDTRKYDAFGGRGDVGSGNNMHYESPLGGGVLGKYDSQFRGPAFREAGSGLLSHNTSSYDPYAIPKVPPRGEKDRERGGRGERERDREDRGRRSSAPSNGDRKTPEARYDRSRREDPLSNKRKSRPFEPQYPGDAYERTEFPRGKELLSKVTFSKDLYSEQQRPTYMTLLEAESSRRREDPDYGIDIYEFPGSMEGSRSNNPSILSSYHRDSRGLLDPQFREDLGGSSRSPRFSGLKSDVITSAGQSFSSREDRLSALPVYESADGGGYGFGTGSYLEKDKAHYSTYERQKQRIGEAEPLLRNSFDLPPYEKGLAPLSNDISRSRFQPLHFGWTPVHFSLHVL